MLAGSVVCEAWLTYSDSMSPMLDVTLVRGATVALCVFLARGHTQG